MISDFQVKSIETISIRIDSDPANKDKDAEYRLFAQMSNQAAIYKKILDGRRVGRISCTATIDAIAASGGKKYASVEVKTVGMFTAGEETEKALFEKMLHINGVTTMIPVIRGMILNISNSAGLQAKMILPNINVMELQWDSETST